VGAAELEHLSLLLGSEAREVLAAVNDDSGFLGSSKWIEGGCLRHAEAALRSEGAALDPCRLAADERQERRSALDAGQLSVERALQLQDSVISR
jgi:hypothetical protein